MKRRFLLWATLAVLALRAVAPLAACASVMAAPGYGDLCSASGKAWTGGATPAGEPGAPRSGHWASHGADCPFGAAPAVLPAAMPMLPAVAATGRATPRLLPPPLRPPSERAAL